MAVSEKHDNRKTLLIDFDRVLHRYSQGWKDGKIYDIPNRGAKEVMARLKRDYRLVIYSTRATSRFINGRYENGQAQEIEEWLKQWSIPYDAIHTGVGKPRAFALIDDKAIRFTSWEQALKELTEFERTKR